MKKQCHKCGKMKDESDFEEGDDICCDCYEEMANDLSDEED